MALTEGLSHNEWRFTEEDSVAVVWPRGALDGNAVVQPLSGLGPAVVVLHDIHQAVPKGAAQLKATVAGRAPVLMLDLRPSVLRVLSREGGGFLGGRVLSVLLDRKCGAGHEAEPLALDAGGVARLASDGFGSCLKCKAALLPTDVEGLDDLSLAQWPEGLQTKVKTALGALDVPRSLGPYLPTRRLGGSSSTDVFLAKDADGGLAAVKRLKPALAKNEALRAMFKRQALLGAQLIHPNVVQALDAGDDWLSMEWVRGWSLQQVLATARLKQEQFPVEVAVRIAADLCAGLSAAHSAADETGAPAPLVHRDVSPHNVLLGDDGVARLSDFGAAVRVGEVGPPPTGKVAYQAPELIKGSAQIDGRADLYAVGALLYEMLTLQPLFQRDTEAATLYAALNFNAPPLADLRPGVPPSLDVLLMFATEKNPAERPQSANDFLLQLERVLQGMGLGLSHDATADWLQRLTGERASGTYRKSERRLPVSRVMPSAPTRDLPRS